MKPPARAYLDVLAARDNALAALRAPYAPLQFRDRGAHR